MRDPEPDDENVTAAAAPDTTGDEQDPARCRATRRLYVRQAASQDAPATRILEVDDRVTVVAVDAEWADIGDGFVRAAYLQLED